LLTISLSRVVTGKGLLQMPVPEIHHKMTEVGWQTIQQIMFEDVKVRQPLHAIE